MSNLEDTVRSVVQDLMDKDELFTALDVSNQVKLLDPNVRHREVRDAVRALFSTFVEPKGWARTPITVWLSDGTTAEALLYHPLSNSWDLDAKYDVQKRAQTSLRPVAVAQAAVQAAQQAASVSTSAAVPASNANTAATTPTPATSPMTVVPMPTARHLWDQLFAKQPSLFPSK